MSTDRIEKTIDVTVMLDRNGLACFTFYEPESGDISRVVTTLEDCAEEESRVGGELLSWLSLMKDELDIMNEEG